MEAMRLKERELGRQEIMEWLEDNDSDLFVVNDNVIDKQELINRLTKLNLWSCILDEDYDELVFGDFVIEKL